MNEQDEHRGLFGKMNVENALLLRAARSFVPLFRAADPRLRQLLLWNARMLAVCVLVSPVGWMLRRLIFPHAVYVSRGFVPFWSGVRELTSSGLFMGLVMLILGFVGVSKLLRDLRRDDLDGPKVGAWHDARWDGFGVYFLLAVATVFLTVIAVFVRSGTLPVRWRLFSCPV